MAAYYLGANQNFLYVGGGGTNKKIDSTHTFSFYVNVSAGQSLTLYGGNFNINGGSAPTDDIYFVLYGCNYACGAPIGSARVNKTSAPTTFAATNFVFTSGGVYYTGSNASPVTLSAGSYFAMLYSNTGTSGAAQYGFKASAASIGDGTNNVSTSIATATTNSQSAAQLSLQKSVSSTSSLINTNFTYTVGIGTVGSEIGRAHV